MSEREIPAHVGPARRFKARKRRELAALERAVYAVLSGCVYTPLTDVGVVLRKVQEWRRAASVKEWGR